MNEERVTDELAARALGWRLAPGRYLKADRSWIPRARFRPLVDLRDAFRLLDAVTNDYTMFATRAGGFTAEVRLGDRVGAASGQPKARAICLALAQVLGIELEAGG